MIPGDLVKLLVDAGGWVTAAITAITLLTYQSRAVQRGDVVAGSIHKRALDANDKLAEAVTGLTNTLNLLSQRVEDALQPRRR